MYFRKQVPVDEILQKIEAVTREDLLEMSERYFRADGVGMTVIGPVKDRAPLLAALEGIRG
jgi:predicted Zn-dependent peptidase